MSITSPTCVTSRPSSCPRRCSQHCSSVSLLTWSTVSSMHPSCPPPSIRDRGGSAYDATMAIAQSLLDDLWDFSDPAGSEARLRAAAQESTDAASRAEFQTQVARALGLQE